MPFLRTGPWLTLAALAAVLGGVGGPAAARADEVLFNNGDRLTGTVLSAEGGKLKIKTKVAGEVTVDLKDVKTFTTDAPVEIRTKEGGVITGRAAASQAPGTVRVPAAAGDAATRDVPLASVKHVNLDQSWTGAVVAGAQFARGNTYADQANISVDAVRRTTVDRLTLNGAYNFGRQREPDTGDKVTSVDNWFAAGKYDYFFTDRFYGYGSLRYEKDRIAQLDRRFVPSLGLGYLWFDEADLKFDTEGGLAFVHEKFESGDTNDALSLRLAYHLKKDLWDDKVSLFHNLEYFPSLERLDDYLVITDAGVRAALTERWFAEYKIEFRHDATPAAGLDKNDYRHVVGLGWKF
jgi:putative salt-induced outer membrane protein YdiY